MELQNNIDDSNKRLTKLSKIIGTDEISNLHCELVHFEEESGIKYYYLLYKIIREKKRRSIILHIEQDDFEMRLSGIAIDTFYGETASLGSDFGQLSDVILNSKAYKRLFATVPLYISFGWMFLAVMGFWVMWMVYEMGGQPGWVAF
ncbi:MAG: hypothetical protein ACYSWP_20510, partial [Planctomycetota bacterium]